MDSPSITKKKQIYIALTGGCFFIATIIFGLWFTDPDRGGKSFQEKQKLKREEVSKKYNISSTNALSIEKNWINRSENRLEDMEQKNRKLKERLKDLERKFIAIEKNKKETIDSVRHLQSSTLKNVDQLLPPPQKPVRTVSLQSTPSQDIPTSQKPRRPENVEIVMIDLSPEKNKKDKTIENYIPSGSFAKIILLSGMDAPTGGLAKSDPLPVAIKLQAHAQLPNSFKSKIKDCHVIGAAYGSMSSERAYIRLESLSCVLNNKKIIEAKIKGFVAGEDGKAGFRGKVVSKQGSIMAKAALAGTLGGIGNALATQSQTVSQNPMGSVTTMQPDKVLESGLMNGASSALNKVADFYIARANETFPIIEIDAGRRGEIVLTAGTQLEFNIGETER